MFPLEKSHNTWNLKKKKESQHLSLCWNISAGDSLGWVIMRDCRFRYETDLNNTSD